MAVNIETYKEIMKELEPTGTTLVAVSKFKPVEDIQVLYDLGQRDFGENFVQELLLKQEVLPKDIRWHFIGHLQSNKVKYIAPFIHLVHGVDTEKLLAEINKQALKISREVNCLLQVFIADEATKFGFDEAEISSIDPSKYPGVHLRGFMGMASFTDDESKIRNEFQTLKKLAGSQGPRLLNQTESPVLSMGMSGDYKLALEEGSSMVRIGSLIFGNRKVQSS
jgi:pyridoxal phosphate enzyme (YggS family)